MTEINFRKKTQLKYVNKNWTRVWTWTSSTQILVDPPNHVRRDVPNDCWTRTSKPFPLRTISPYIITSASCICCPRSNWGSISRNNCPGINVRLIFSPGEVVTTVTIMMRQVGHSGLQNIWSTLSTPSTSPRYGEKSQAHAIILEI